MEQALVAAKPTERKTYLEAPRTKYTQGLTVLLDHSPLVINVYDDTPQQIVDNIIKQRVGAKTEVFYYYETIDEESKVDDKIRKTGEVVFVYERDGRKYVRERRVTDPIFSRSDIDSATRLEKRLAKIETPTENPGKFLTVSELDSILHDENEKYEMLRARRNSVVYGLRDQIAYLAYVESLKRAKQIIKMSEEKNRAREKYLDAITDLYLDRERFKALKCSDLIWAARKETQLLFARGPADLLVILVYHIEIKKGFPFVVLDGTNIDNFDETTVSSLDIDNLMTHSFLEFVRREGYRGYAFLDHERKGEAYFKGHKEVKKLRAENGRTLYGIA